MAASPNHRRTATIADELTDWLRPTQFAWQPRIGMDGPTLRHAAANATADDANPSVNVPTPRLPLFALFTTHKETDMKTTLLSIAVLAVISVIGWLGWFGSPWIATSPDAQATWLSNQGVQYITDSSIVISDSATPTNMELRMIATYASGRSDHLPLTIQTTSGIILATWDGETLRQP